ncbi:MAG: hypothetical protein QXK37_05510 [Candidatus Woesearchaeota archaeon]
MLDKIVAFESHVTVVMLKNDKKQRKIGGAYTSYHQNCDEQRSLISAIKTSSSNLKHASSYYTFRDGFRAENSKYYNSTRLRYSENFINDLCLSHLYSKEPSKKATNKKIDWQKQNIKFYILLRGFMRRINVGKERPTLKRAYGMSLDPQLEEFWGQLLSY